MDEIEHRLAALELLAIESLSLQPARLARAEAVIRSAALNASGDELVIRLQALQIIEDARKRHDVFSGGG